MFLEAVLVCVNYADFLAVTLPLNKRHFDRIVVVTIPQDFETIRVCEENGVEYHTTECFFDAGAPFRKGRGVNEGLGCLKLLDWVLHLDADVLLPGDFREALEGIKLDKRSLYSCSRYQILSYAETEPLLAFLEKGEVVPKAVNKALRVNREGNLRPIVGFIPIGFFQLWNYPTTGHRYAEDSRDASTDDVKFAFKWTRERRFHLKEFLVYHLESEGVPMMTNWKGRKTKRFGPTP